MLHHPIKGQKMRVKNVLSIFFLSGIFWVFLTLIIIYITNLNYKSNTNKNIAREIKEKMNDDSSSDSYSDSYTKKEIKFADKIQSSFDER